MLDGPGAMGGAVNLVTRKPTKAFEAEARGVLEKSGAYYSFEGSTLGQGREKTRLAIIADPSLCARIGDAMRGKVVATSPVVADAAA